MSGKSKARRFNGTIFGGFNKKEVAVYIEKVHKSYRAELESCRHEAKALRGDNDELQAECDLLRTQLSAAGSAEEPVDILAEKAVEAPSYRSAEPIDEYSQQALVISELEAELAQLSGRLESQTALVGRLETQLQSQTESAREARREADELKAQAARLADAARELERAKESEYETLAYHRAEEIEREALHNAAQVRLALENMLLEAGEVIRGIKAQTVHETTQLTVRASLFLEMLASMPELFDTVGRRFDEVRPESVATPIGFDDFE